MAIHANEVIFTESSLKSFIGKIKTDIRDWEIKTDDNTLGYIKYHKQNQEAGVYTRVAVKGFNSSGNFTGSNSSSRSLVITGTSGSTTLRSYDGTQYIETDSLYAYRRIGSTNFAVPAAYVNNIYTGREFINTTDHAPGDNDSDDYWQKGYGKTGTIGTSGAPFGTGYIIELHSTDSYGTNLGSETSPWTQAYINNLGSSTKPVNKAYIKDLYITDGGKIHGESTFDGILIITDDTEATRTATNAYNSSTPPDDYFNITAAGKRLTATDQTYYIRTDGGTGTTGAGTAANTTTVYPTSTQFYTRSTSYTSSYVFRESNPNNYTTYYYFSASPSTVTVAASKKFKNNTYASQYYTKSGSTYTVCNTTNDYNGVTLYINAGADPALGINYSANMTLTGSITTRGGIAAGRSIKGYRIHAAVFNDYAEYRQTDSQEPGRCVIEIGNGNMTLSSKRLQPGANIVSDTFGFSIGETNLAQTPIAVCGRVLAYPFENKQIYEPGDAVCSGPNGTISKMTREEIREWPDRIVGYVSEIPSYEFWGSDQVKVNGRIWIKIK